MSRSDAPTPGVPFLDLLAELSVPIDPDLLQLALTHRSYSYEHGQIPHNERLEFLGDAVLGVVVTDYLYRHFPKFPEGKLAKLRAAVVSSVSLAEVAKDLQIGPMIKLGKGEQSTHGEQKTSILADTTEALLGATHLTSAEGARKLIRHIFEPLVDHAATLGAGLDWKTSLQELSAELEMGAPEYKVSTSGPDHDKHFKAWVLIGDETFAPGEGSSKKAAEQIAAANAYRKLREEHPDSPIPPAAS